MDGDLVHCSSDNLTYSYLLYSSPKPYQHPFVYCGYRNFPPPFLSFRTTKQFRIHFRSNDDSDAGLGFDGRYLFLNQSNEYFSSCRSPFDPIVFVNETLDTSGTISTDGYPENVICEWSYMTGAGFQFNLEIDKLDLEGSKTKDPPPGCQSSVLRIYSEKGVEELCGQQEKSYYLLTDSNWFTLQFISLTRQTKEPLFGFHLFWTVVKVKSNENGVENSCSSHY